MNVDFRLLGPVEVVAGAGPVDLGPPQRRVVLAVLATDVGRPVAVDTMVDRVWEDPPAGARRAIYVHITHLRRSLQAVGGAVSRRDGGYVLEADRPRVDLHRFEAAVRQAGTWAVDHPGRADLLHEVLTLWRGAPLSGLAGPWATGVRQRWTRLRVDALIAWAESELHRGGASDVVGPLREAVAENPTVEPLAVLLMRALDSAGRGTEAIRYFAELREQLVEELGAEPGAQLRETHRTILLRNANTSTVEQPPAVVRQLPAVTYGFTGRRAELARIETLVGVAGGDAAAVPIAVVSGPPGVGKTALALAWAHRSLDRFPDGQLYVDLRGYDPGAPVRPADALGALLRDLGLVSPPPDLAGRSAALRSLLAGRRMLLLLDNAADDEQVRPLLPGAGGTTVIVTSRNHLSGLVAQFGAHRTVLAKLSNEDALALLKVHCGAVVDRDPAGAALVVHRCAGLPVALRAVAELLARRPRAGLTALAEELADPRARIDLLDSVGDGRTAVRAVFSWSYERLGPEGARLFRLLGRHPASPVDSAAAAGLLGSTRSEARRLLDVLAGEHLLRTVSADTYRMPDLLHSYAASCSRRS